MRAPRIIVLLACAACGGQEREPSGADAATSASADIGPEGGSLAACGSFLAVPPRSLTTTQTITISCDPIPTVSGYALASPLVRVQPEGLAFVQPVTVMSGFRGVASSAMSLYWSRADGSGYEAIPWAVQGDFVVGIVTHFGTGFVGFPR
jgi:hypothetical protein